MRPRYGRHLFVKATTIFVALPGLGFQGWWYRSPRRVAGVIVVRRQLGLYHHHAVTYDFLKAAAVARQHRDQARYHGARN